MTTVLFVHGTGVRESSYETSFGLIEGALNGLGIAVEPCFWGQECGTDLFLAGASIPEFDATMSVEIDPQLEPDLDVALWSLLYSDPLAELSLLALRERPDDVYRPGVAAPGEDLRASLLDLDFQAISLPDIYDEQIRHVIQRGSLANALSRARDQLVESPAFADALHLAQEPLGEYRYALARALIASTTQGSLHLGQLPEEATLLSAHARDQLVAQIATAMGGIEMGVSDWIRHRAGRLISKLATSHFLARRSRYSRDITPFAADIMAYQARPHPLRTYIRSRLAIAIAKVRESSHDGRVVVLAHSLGGIACVDALVESPDPAPAALITVGSQAPLLHEIDALTSLALPRGADGRPTGKPAHLPDHFPTWLNIYDRRDFLSYCASPVFGHDRVADVAVDNRQPFPAAHSAYWSNDETWEAIRSFCERTLKA